MKRDKKRSNKSEIVEEKEKVRRKKREKVDDRFNTSYMSLASVTRHKYIVHRWVQNCEASFRVFTQYSRIRKCIVHL